MQYFRSERVEPRPHPRVYSIYIFGRATGGGGGRAADHRPSLGRSDSAKSTSCRPRGTSSHRPSIPASSTFWGRCISPHERSRALRQSQGHLPRRAEQACITLPDADGRPVARRGHGPFGHFFDQHYLSAYGLTHETLGAHIIRHELGESLRRIRRNPEQSPGRGRNAGPRADRPLDRSPERRGRRRRPAVAPIAAGPVQRPLHRRQHGLRAPRRIYVRLQPAGVRPRPAPALQRLHAARADDPRARALGLGPLHRRPG